MAIPLRARSAALLCALAVGGVSGCTGSTGARPPATRVRTSTVVATSTVPTSTVPTEPVPAGPTTARTARSCPLVTRRFVQDSIGMRLARTTVLRSAGDVVGCRFYALQHSPLHDSEHLPGPHQPATEITTQRYPSAAAAHNAVVRLAAAGRNPQRHDFGGGRTGACFQIDFYAVDHGADWACAASAGRTEVVVRTVVTSPALDAALVTRRVLGGH